MRRSRSIPNILTAEHDNTGVRRRRRRRRGERSSSLLTMTATTSMKLAKRVRAGRLQKRRRFLPNSTVSVEYERKWVSTDGTAFVRTTDEERLMMESLMNEFGPMPCHTRDLFHTSDIVDCMPLARTSLALVVVKDTFSEHVQELYLLDFLLDRCQMLSNDYGGKVYAMTVTPDCEHVLLSADGMAELYSLVTDSALPMTLRDDSGNVVEVMKKIEVPTGKLSHRWPLHLTVDEGAKELVCVLDQRVIMVKFPSFLRHNTAAHVSVKPVLLNIGRPIENNGSLRAVAYSRCAQTRLFVELYLHDGTYKIRYTQDVGQRNDDDVYSGRESGEQAITLEPDPFSTATHRPPAKCTRLVCSTEYGYAAFAASDYHVVAFSFYDKRVEVIETYQNQDTVVDLFIDPESGDLAISSDKRRRVRFFRFGRN